MHDCRLLTYDYNSFPFAVEAIDHSSQTLFMHVLLDVDRVGCHRGKKRDIVGSLL